MKNILQIFKIKNFSLLWIVHFISKAGDSIFMIALPWLMLDLTGSSQLTALITLSAYVPPVLFGLIAGVFIDFYNKKMIMICSELLGALLVFIIPLSILFNFINPLLIGCITFLLSTIGTFFHPTRDSLIPQLVSANQLPLANSSINLSKLKKILR